jgi:hypothetical protein
MMVALEASLDLPAALAQAAIDAVREQAAASGLRGAMLAALLRTAALAAEPRRAAQAAHEALVLATTVAPTLMMRSEVWACAARGLRAGGEDPAAVLQAGRVWVQAVAAQDVDEAFRESFLQRQPVHRELLGA